MVAYRFRYTDTYDENKTFTIYIFAESIQEAKDKLEEKLKNPWGTQTVQGFKSFGSYIHHATGSVQNEGFFYELIKPLHDIQDRLTLLIFKDVNVTDPFYDGYIVSP